MARTLKICLVVFAWITIGAEIALSFSPSFVAFTLGLVAGSLGGYLTVEWRTVVWAIPIAWRRATSWRPNWTKLLQGLGIGLGLGVAIIVWVSCNALPLVLLALFHPSYDEAVKWVVIPLETLLSCGIPHIAVNAFYEFRGDELPKKPLPLLCMMNFWIFTTVGIILAVKAASRQLPKVIRSSPHVFHRVVHAFAVGAHFCWHLWRLIHTEERWLVAVDIAVGITIGFVFGVAIVGGLSGAAFWIANRLLIAGLLLKTLPVRVR